MKRVSALFVLGLSFKLTSAKYDAVRRLQGLQNGTTNLLDWPECRTKYVLLLGEHLYNSRYSYYNYDTTAGLPSPGNQDLFNLPVYDAENCMRSEGNWANLTQIGSVQEQVVYLPSPTADSLECLGQEVWTLEDGQFSNSYTCQGPESAPTMITGGTGRYRCKHGFTEVVNVTEGFFQGSGYIVWRISACNLLPCPL